MKKGLALLSGIIFLAITVSATLIVYEAGIPIVKKMQASATIENMKDFFTELDSVIKTVSTEGKGSKRTLSIDIASGKLIVNDTQDSIYWEFETDASVISPRTTQDFGTIRIGSNLETRCYEGNYSSNDTYILENEHLTVYINKLGSAASYEDYDTSEIILAIYQKDLKRWLNNTGFFEVTIDNRESSKSGSGYITVSATGYNLPYVTATAYIASNYINYYIDITLESGADFLQIGVRL